MPAKSAGAVGIDLVLNGGKYEQQVAALQNKANLASNKISGAFKKIGVSVAAALSTKAIVAFGKECTELGSDLAEVQNVVDVTFSTMNTKLNTWAKNAAASYGLSETMAKKFASLYGTMARSNGLSEQAAYDMSTALTGLAGDVASFYNMDHEQAYTKLKAVFSGETEVLKDIGIVMTEDALNSYALAKGINKTVNDMTQAEKVSLRYEFILNQLSAAQGDFTRTQDNWANQVRVLQLRFDSLKATIGQGLINALTPTLKIVNKLIERAQVLAEAFSSAMGAIFGVSSSTSNAVASTVAAEQELTESAEDSASAVDDVTDSINDSADAAKGSVASFDKLNILSKPDSDTSSSSSSVAMPSVDTSPVVSQADSLSKEISDKWKNSGIVKYIKDISDTTKKWLDKLKLSPLTTSVKKLKDAFKNLASVCGEKFKVVYQKILLPFAKWTIEKAVPKLIEILAKAFKGLANIIKSLKLSTLQNFASVIAGIVAGNIAFKFAKGIIKMQEAYAAFLAFAEAHPYAVLFTGIAVAVTGMVAAIKQANATRLEELGFTQARERVDEYIDKIQECKENIESMNDEINGSLEETATELGVVDQYKARLDELLDKTTLSASEQAELVTIGKYFSDKYPEFEEAWNKYISVDDDGKVTLIGNVDEIKASLDTLIEKYRQVAAQDALSSIAQENTKNKISAQIEVNTASVEYNKALKELEDFKNKWNLTEENIKEIKTSGRGMWTWQRESTGIGDQGQTATYKQLREQLEQLENGVSTAEKTYDDAAESAAQLYKNSDDLAKMQAVVNGNYDDAAAVLMAYNTGLISTTQIQQSQWKTLENLQKKAAETNENTIFGMTNGLSAYEDQIKNKGDEAAKLYLRGFDEEMEINSPSRAMYRRGVWSIQGLLNALNNMYRKVTSPISKIVNLIKEKIDPIKSIFSNAFSAIWGITRPILNNLMTKLEDFINGFISSINNLSSGIDVVVGGIGDLFGQEWSVGQLSLVNLPRFAKGAIVKAPTLAVVGDNPGAGNGDPEVISPLSKLQTMMNTSSGQDLEILTQILDYLKRIYEMFVVFRNNGGNMYEFIAKLYDEPIFDAVVRQNELYKKRHNGQSAF